MFDIVTVVNMSEKLQKSAYRTGEDLPQLELMRLFSLLFMECGASSTNVTSQMRPYVVCRLLAMSMSRMCN